MDIEKIKKIARKVISKNDFYTDMKEFHNNLKTKIKNAPKKNDGDKERENKYEILKKIDSYLSQIKKQ